MANKPHILVTAGPTREKIDEVRDWGNIFSGHTGLDLALAFLDIGDVTLLTSNLEHAKEYDGYYGKTGMLGVETFRSHAELLDLLAERMTNDSPDGRVDVVAMTAAVADYAPAGVYRIVERKVENPKSENRNPKSEIGNIPGHREVWVVENVQAGKVKSSHGEIAIRGVATEKLIDLFRTKWKFTGTLIKFKLEVGLSDADLLKVAAASRLASKADLMVANTLAMARPADGSEGGAYLIDNAGALRVGRKELAARVVQWVRRKLST